jgi:hypothetical protein
MHFGTKNYLKSTRNHTAKHAISPLTWNSNKKSCRGKCCGLFSPLITNIEINHFRNIGVCRTNSYKILNLSYIRSKIEKFFFLILIFS